RSRVAACTNMDFYPGGRSRDRRATSPQLPTETCAIALRRGVPAGLLCPKPVDRMPPVLRRATRRSGEQSLARTKVRLHPQMIATMLRSIEGNVSHAVAQALWSG